MDINANSINAATQQYYQPKPADDIDLIAEVRATLVAAGLGNKLAEAFDTNRFILEAAGKHSSVQRYFMNRYWGQQLLYAKVQSIDERYCLLPNGTIQDWLNLFQQKILPFVIANDLPMACKNA